LTHGDFDHQMGFPLNNYSLFADLRPGIDSEVASMYRMFKGLPASRAEYQFLSHVKMLDDGSLSTLCIETTGIVLRSQSASGSQRRPCFFWPRIKKFQLKKHRMVMKVRSKAEEGGIHEFRTDDKHQLQELVGDLLRAPGVFPLGHRSVIRDRRLATPPARKRPRRRPYRRPRRREFEHSDQWLHDLRQQEASQHQLHLQQAAAENAQQTAIDTRSMRDIRAPVASTSSRSVRPFMSDSEAVTKTNKFNMVRERYYQRSKRHLTSDELYDSRAGSGVATPSPPLPPPPPRRPAAGVAVGGRSWPRPPSGLLSHIRHDRVDSSGLSQEQLRQIEFTQLPS
uniref:IRS-type PTB domain-containing protein n=1 Tax=Macrostomum lignano TaxID=282301 RepID=A0A1I8FS09_9PLAT